MIVIVTAINLLGGFTPFTEAILEPIYLLRLAVSCPALLLILLATYVPALRRHYQAIAAVAVVVNGLAVMTIERACSQVRPTAVPDGRRAGDGLRHPVPRPSVPIRVRGRGVPRLCVRHDRASARVPGQDLVFAASVLVATGLMAVLSAARVERLMRTTFVETQLLNDIAERDGLSGLYNRRMFDTLTRRLWQQAQREQESLQVILVDIDHFKRFNDLYGHQAGDDCIRRVARRDRQCRAPPTRLLCALRRRRVRARPVRPVKHRLGRAPRAAASRHHVPGGTARAIRTPQA